MPEASVRCETAAELFETLVHDVIEATCSPEDKRLAALKLVQFTIHPEVRPAPPSEEGRTARDFGL